MKTKSLHYNKLSFILLLIVASSCGSYTTGVRREDLFNRFKKTELEAVNNWKFGDDRLILKQNNTFRYCVNAMGITTEYYAGSYERFNDTIVLSFHKNRQPIAIRKDKDNVTISLNELSKPGFFKQSDTLLLTSKTSCNGTQQILKNSEGDYLVVVTAKPIQK